MTCVENDFSSVVALSLLVVVVLFQVLGLGLYQAGALYLKSTNTLLIQALLNIVLGSILWYSVGYSLVFGTSSRGFIGSPSMAFFIDVSVTNCSTHAQNVPNILFATFEMLLAVCAPFMIVAPWTEYISMIGAVSVFLLWPLVVYYPLSHWIRGGGWLEQMDIIDYAGSLTVHTSAGVAGLVFTRVLRQRLVDQVDHKSSRRFGDRVFYHVIFIVGALVTSFGWSLFNLGSVGMAQNAGIGLAVVNTHLSSCASCLCWVIVIAIGSSQCHYWDLMTGIIAGIVGVSAAPCSMHAWAAILTGLIVGFTSSFVQSCVRKYGISWTNGSEVDFAYSHGIPGTLGALTAGLFTDPSLDAHGHKGAFYSNGKQLGVQFLGVVMVTVWSAVFTYLITWFIHCTVGFNITRNTELSVDGASSKVHSGYRTKLFTAAMNGQLQELEELAAQHVNFNMKDFDNQTALLLASSHGHIQCVKFILRQPTVDIHAKDRWRSTALTEAIKHGHDRIAQCLIRHGSSWSKDGAGDILCSAVAKNDMEEIHRLVSMGVDVNAPNSEGSYAIHTASKLGSRVVVQYLIDQRADINTIDSSGNSPLNYSDMHEHRAVTQLLEGLGARRVSRHYNIQEICEVATTGNLQMLRHMVHNGASVCYRDVNHRTPLHVSAAEGHLDLVKFLVLQPGIDVNAEDKHSFTPLLDSIFNKHHDVAEFLKSHGATINECKLASLVTEMARTGDVRNLKRMLRWIGHVDIYDFDGNTALHVAAVSGRDDVVGMLLKEGADGSLLNRCNKTPLELACSFHHPLVEKELRKHLKINTHTQDKVSTENEEDTTSTSCYRRKSRLPKRNFKTQPSTYHYQSQDSWSSTDLSVEARKNLESRRDETLPQTLSMGSVQNNTDKTPIGPSFLRVMPVSQLSLQTRELTGGQPDYV